LSSIKARLSTVPVAVSLAGAVLQIGVDDVAAARLGTAALTIDLRTAAHDAALLRDIVADLTRGYGLVPPSGRG
jgi:hypothetical protein